MSNLVPREFHFGNIRIAQSENQAFYNVIDVIAELRETDYKTAQNYYKTLKTRLIQEGNETVTNCNRLKFLTSDGKYRLQDAMNREQILRLIQSIPSPKAEPFKLWLAQVGAERLEEAADPELGIRRAQNRAADTYEKRGMDSAWIAARLKGIDDRKAFTDALQQHVAGILGKHYGMATNAVYRGLWGRDSSQLKEEMGIPQKANLRDHQPRLAHISQAMVEAAVSEILEERQIVTPPEAMRIIQEVANVVQVQAEMLSRMTGKDIATGKPLLNSKIKPIKE